MNAQKSSALLIALLLSVSGCGHKKKERKVTHQKADKMAQSVDMPLADDTDFIADGNIDSYFDQDVNEFVDRGEYEGDTDTVASGDADENLENDAFAWVDEGDNKDEYNFETVYYEFDRYKADAEQTAKVNVDIETAKKAIEQDAGTTVVLEGHACHSAGSAVYNMAISEKRAKDMADKFAESGISRDRMKVVGLGKEVPAVVNGQVVTGDRYEQAPNRRVEMHVVHG